MDGMWASTAAVLACSILILAGSVYAASQNVPQARGATSVKKVSPPVTEYSLVTVYWPENWYTFRLPGVVGDVFGEKLTFFIDDQRIKDLDIGETFTVRLPLGVHYMRYERRFMGSFAKGGVPITLKNPHHYFRVHHVQKINDWEEVSEDVGRPAAEKLSQAK
jgi:hypothetical protein